ncbi:MAG: dihydroneopterin aldolase [Cytophagales bacterium]|nr:MAG: dihydroneopterin aldolase [Cytophagales bacterium]
MQKGTIELIGVDFFAYHGVGAAEQQVGNRYTLDLKLSADLLKACQTDNVQHTIDYAEVYQLLAQEMKTPSHLLEHLAYKMVQILKKTYPQISYIYLKVSKHNPPIGSLAAKTAFVWEESW